MDEIKAQLLLAKCRGDEIWSIETCREEGIPQVWIDELSDAFESGFDSDRNTIYVESQKVNQYHGVQDLHLAFKLAEFLGVDCQAATQFSVSRTSQVSALKDAFEEL
ncbi:MAG: hypothetical protein AAGA30_18870 [Planctomycetota bacterium]